MEEWKEYTIDDICKTIFAGGDAVKYNPTKNKTEENNIPIYANSVDNEGLYGYCSKPLVTEPAVTVAARGAGTGFVCYRKYPYVPIVRLLTLIPNGNVDAHFLYYRLKKNFIKGDGSAIPQLTVPMIKKEKITLPSLVTQQKIANILSSLDDKIEVNRRINEQLEELAQALFKSWFVDFEPFKDGEFVDSELGMIPKGWKVGTLGELIEIKYGKDHKKLSDGNIPVYGSGGIMRYVDKSLYEGESVLIPRKGTLNNVIYVNRDFWTVDTMFFSKMKMKDIAIFIYLFLSKKDLASMNSGSAVPSMTVEILNRIPLVIPNNNVFEDFNRIVSSLFSQMDNNTQEIHHLTTLRDTLLPKLMSGEIDVNEVKI